MLQIGSGKLFTRGIGRRNELRGVLFTNFIIAREESIVTAAGRLLPTSTYDGTLIYEFAEAIEEEPVRPGLLISHTMAPYLLDFAAVASFALDVTCTPEATLTRRLTSGERGLSVRAAPDKLVRRRFDRQVWCQEQDTARLIRFVEALIGLRRREFLGAMRAIRTFVTAMHRLGDDAELAYTLLVASIESLAQGFDGHRAEWQDYDEEKRRTVDAALAGAASTTADRVREALLAIEHVSLGRRFRDFTLAHLAPSFFREEAEGQEHPVGRAELRATLSSAYRLRSQYVHNLTELPKMLSVGHSYTETITVERVPVLTFQGLARLARHVITQFIWQAPKVDAEPYDYSLERSGVLQAQLAAQYWIWRTDGLAPDHGRQRLEGFLEQYAAHLGRVPDAALTDLRDLLTTAEAMLPNMRIDQRRPFLVLHFLFNRLVPAIQRMATAEAIARQYSAELNAPSVESLIGHLVLDVVPEWPLTDHEAMHAAYFRRRDRRNGLRMSRILESGLTLTLAERYRIAGALDDTRRYLALAVENHPGHLRLRELENAFEPTRAIDWNQIVLPQDDASGTPAS